MKKYVVLPVSSLYEYDVYFNRKRKDGFIISKSFFNFVILKKVDEVKGKYVLYEDEHEDIKPVYTSRQAKLGFTENNNIRSIEIKEREKNAFDLVVGTVASFVLSLLLVFLILTKLNLLGYIGFVLMESLLLISALYGINNIIELIKLMRKTKQPITRFDIARKSTQFMAVFLSLIFLLMVLTTSIIQLNESAAFVIYFIWLGVFILSVGYLIIKLYDNSIQALSMILISALVFFFFQTILYAQLFIPFIA